MSDKRMLHGNGSKKHFVAGRAPLCVSTAFYRHTLGGFDMNYFRPRMAEFTSDEICQRCLARSREPNVQLLDDGTYKINDPWFDSLSPEQVARIRYWDSRAGEAGHDRFWAYYRQAKQELDERGWSVVQRWFAENGHFQAYTKRHSKSTAPR